MTLDELSEFVEQQRLEVERKTGQRCTILLQEDRSQWGCSYYIHVMYGPKSGGPVKWYLDSRTQAAAWLREAVEHIDDPNAIAPWFTLPQEGCAA